MLRPPLPCRCSAVDTVAVATPPLMMLLMLLITPMLPRLMLHCRYRHAATLLLMPRHAASPLLR